MLLFAHKLRSCWCLHTNLTLQNILGFFTPPPPPQEFSGGDASVPRSSALKGLNHEDQMVLINLKSYRPMSLK